MKSFLHRAILIAFMGCGSLFLLTGSAHAQSDGASLFKTKCAACHGADGSGNTPMGENLKIRDLRSDEVQKQTDDQIIAIITNGKSPMPSYKGKLTDDQIKQLTAYIRELAKKK